MDKSDVKVHENQSDTSSVITMKEYASSEYPSSEPPPAYMKPRSNALRIAKLAAFTVIVSSLILGGFMFAASWIQARATRNLDLTLNQELLDDLHPNYEQLVGNEAIPEQQVNPQESAKNLDDGKRIETKDKVIMDKNEEGLVPPPPPEEKQEEKKSMDLDEIASMLMQKNVRGNVNCIVEKRRNEELVDHAPMSLNLPSGNIPFGINITTPPRLQHVTGEQIIVICKGDEDEGKDEGEEEDKAEQIQPIVFPLPQQMVHQFHQLPQIIPVAQLIHQIPVQQPVFRSIPVQQPMLQQQPQFSQMEIQRQPQRLIVHPVAEIQFQRVNVQGPQHVQPPAPIHLQQAVFQQQVPFNQPQIIHKPEVFPIREVRLNEERIPLNHILHNRVAINPMAINEVPISQMPITHMPMKTEVQMEEEPVPVHHLVPPQPQEEQFQNFNQEGPRFNRPILQERGNRFPFVPSAARVNPEVREPRLLRLANPMAQRLRFPVFPTPDAQMKTVQEVREPPFSSFPRPVEGRAVPVPSPEMKAPLPFRRVFPGPSAGAPDMKVVRMIPLFDESRKPMPPQASNRIRFPDSSESEETEETEENRLPIITEITKIIPIRIEREETKLSPMPLLPLDAKPETKSEVDKKLEKMQARPFPIPINTILDMIFRGIRPLMGNRVPNMPIPIDIKIERIEKKPFDGLPIIKKLEVLEKEPENAGQDSQERQESVENQPEPNTLIMEEIKSADKGESNDDADRDMVEAKVERVEIYDKEEEDTHPIPIPADAQDPQIFKIDGTESQPEGKVAAASFENRAFLPNGQGRGARVFPIPQEIREAEIFSVSDARSNKNMNVEVESSFVVDSENAKNTEGRQGRVLAFPQPMEREINSFPIPEGRAMKPFAVQTTPQLQSQTFTVSDARSIQLFPVEGSQEEAGKPMPQSGTPNEEEMRPHLE